MDKRVVYVVDRVLPTEALPKLGIIYTIRAIIPCRELYGYGDDALHVVEIVNPPRPLPSGSRHELGFRISRFRPVRDTNIEIFKAMLAPLTPARQLEEVC